MPEKSDHLGFFTILGAGGAVGGWLLACWLVGPLGMAPPVWAHLVVPATLMVLVHYAGRPFEEAGARGLGFGVGSVLIAFALISIVTATAVGASAGAWATLRLLATRAEAGVLTTGASDGLLAGFRPFGLVIFGLAVSSIGYGYLYGHRRLVVSRLTIRLRNLPEELSGVRIVHVSDLHLGPLTNLKVLRQNIDRILALDPDLVCVTGDLTDSEVTDVEGLVPELDRLTARHGVFAIFGNHDRYTGTERVAAAFARSTRWRILRDEVATVEIAGTRLHLAGLEDRRRGAETEKLADLLALVPAEEPFLLLAHRPSIFPMAADAGVPLMLCGHTHGGQLAVPGLPSLNVARFVMTRFSIGLFTRGASVLHVTRGLGEAGQRVRLGAPREISEVTLQAA